MRKRERIASAKSPKKNEFTHKDLIGRESQFDIGWINLNRMCNFHVFEISLTSKAIILVFLVLCRSSLSLRLCCVCSDVFDGQREITTHIWLCSSKRILSSHSTENCFYYVSRAYAAPFVDYYLVAFPRDLCDFLIIIWCIVLYAMPMLWYKTNDDVVNEQWRNGRSDWKKNHSHDIRSLWIIK